MSVMQAILQKIFEATHTPAVGPQQVPMLASADAAVLDPSTPGAAQPMPPELAATPQSGVANAPAPSATTPVVPPHQGFLGTLGSILAPQAGSFWASALKHGLAGAHEGMIEDPLAHAMEVAKLQGAQGEANTSVASGKEARAGLKMTPQGDIVGIDTSHPGAPIVNQVYNAPDKTDYRERLIDRWSKMTEQQQKTPLGRLLFGAAMGSSIQYTPEVLDALTQSRIAVTKAKTFAPKGGGKGSGGGASKPPTGYQ